MSRLLPFTPRPYSPTSTPIPISPRPHQSLPNRVLSKLQASSSKSIAIAPLGRPAASTPVAGALASRKIYRFYDHLWTEKALPVKIDPNGGLIYLNPEAIPLHQRTSAKAMIDRYRMTVAPIITPPPKSPPTTTSSFNSSTTQPQ